MEKVRRRRRSSGESEEERTKQEHETSSHLILHYDGVIGESLPLDHLRDVLQLNPIPVAEAAVALTVLDEVIDLAKMRHTESQSASHPSPHLLILLCLLGSLCWSFLPCLYLPGRLSHK